MGGVSMWNGEPIIKYDPDLHVKVLTVMRVGSDGRRSEVGIFPGGLAGYRAGDREGTMILYAGTEITIQAEDYARARRLILEWASKTPRVTKEMVMPEVSAIGDIDIGYAIRMLKSGHKVRRAAWRDQTKYLWLKQGETVKSDRCTDPEVREIAEACGGTITCSPVICMYMTKDDAPYVLTGWHPTPLDLLAEDWIILE